MFYKILGYIMQYCYHLFNNYGLAIILFTFLSKIILLPISIIVQKNSIKMVKMQPSINQININYFGDKDRIADETAILYKKEKYNAFISLIPLIIQIILLIGLVQVINNPITYILNMDKPTIDKYKTVLLETDKSINPDSSALELLVVKDLQNNNSDKYIAFNGEDNLKIKNLDLNFLGFDMSWIAIDEHGLAYLIPIIAGLSALIMCIGQNIMNVLQAEQSNINKYGMLVLSVGLSLYLGAFVPAGVALYWTFSNLFAVLQQWLLNIFINPKKSVNYEDLNKTRNELLKLKQISKNNKRSKEQIKKERKDYKSFFKIVNKHLVFYSEGNGFYKYYKGIIEYILKNTNITIHYITSDYNDNIFNLAKNNKQIKAYYIDEEKLLILMMKIEADVVVMTMPDLNNYHIKRSYLRKNITYIYIPHSLDSLNLTMRNKSMNHYDVVFATGKYQKEEMIKTNELYNLKNRKIVEWGYSLLDDMIKNYKEKDVNKKSILIAPSWQKDNIIDLCLEDILNSLKNENYDIIVRPHPQHVKLMKEKIDAIKEKYKNNKNIIIETDFSSNETVFNSSIMITDWSGIAYEYSFTTKKPVIFIDTPMKVMNEKYKEIDVEPFNIWSRNEIGKVVKIEDIKSLNNIINDMLINTDKYSEKINTLLNESVYNLGESSKVGANYIINCIQEKIKERSNNNENKKNNN